ncbi:MAG: chromosomal replication initiator protein DnaA, partial [Actinomycetales bacterium]
MTDAVDSEPDLSQVWSDAIDTLGNSGRVWVYSAQPLSLHGGLLIVAVPDEITRRHIESRVRPALEHALSSKLGADTRLVVTIEPDLQSPRGSSDDSTSTSSKDHHSTLSTVMPRDAAPVETEDDDDVDDFVPSWATAPAVAPARVGNAAEARLNPRYLFENFVIGSSNRFAHAAAVAAAEAPGKAYNPLVIHGESGLGKTHLLHAIGHYVLNLYPSSRVRYVNSEEFTNDVINAIGENRTAALRRKYREIDVLLVDDIQFLEGKESTQEEFFHTFNALHNENKQIVMTSDRPPKLLKTLEDRLRNRFEWGLQTEMLPPDLETRIAILRKKAASEQLTAPADVLEFIASKVQTNIRELEGALIRATAFANLQG